MIYVHHLGKIYVLETRSGMIHVSLDDSLVFFQGAEVMPGFSRDCYQCFPGFSRYMFCPTHENANHCAAAQEPSHERLVMCGLTLYPSMPTMQTGAQEYMLSGIRACKSYSWQHAKRTTSAQQRVTSSELMCLHFAT